MASVAHLEAVVDRMANMTLAETRQLYSILRMCDFEEEKDDVVIGNALLPLFGVTIADVGLAYVLNTSRSTRTR